MEGEPFEEPYARRLARNILTGGRVAFTQHAMTEMRKDRLSEVDVVNALRAGRARFPEHVRGTWRYRFLTTRIAVVIAFRSTEELAIVTAWRIKT